MEILTKIKEWISNINFDIPEISWSVFPYFTFIIRFLLPVLAGIVLYRCIRSFFTEGQEKETWGKLTLPNGTSVELEHWENTIGRSKSSDVALEYPTISRNHAALIRDADGNWQIYDLNSKGGVCVNEEKIEGSAPVKSGDSISLGGVELMFWPRSQNEEREQSQSRQRPGKVFRPSVTFLYLTEFQLLLGVEHCINRAVKGELDISLPISFAALILIMWLYYIFIRSMGRTGFEPETIAFMLCTIGLSVAATSVPESLYKQIVFIMAGILMFLCIGWFLRDLDRAKKMRWPIAAAGVLFLIINLVAAKAVFGAKNWLTIGGISLQPSEFVKICFVFAGAATLDRLFAKRNLFLFVAYAGMCAVVLALMSDFGTAAVFFMAYLVIAYMRSGDVATVFLSVGGAGFAGVLAISVKPYILARFSTWGHAWEFVNEGGYQQTRTMAAAASGGLFGVGAGDGWLKNVFAADTDMVFGIVCEELGLAVAVIAVLSIAALAIFAIKAAAASRSSFYAIGACAAVSMLVFQTILNVLGSVDILPFTGVTFPFLSRGGSSLLTCWGLLAFIKAADTRQNASFAIRLPKKVRIPRIKGGENA